MAEKEFKTRTDEINPGVYSLDEVVRVTATVSKAPNTSVADRFDYLGVVRDVLLLYASHIPDGESWLRQVFGENSYFTSSLANTLTREKALQSIKPELVTLWDELFKLNKELFPTKNVPRAGSTTVVGTITPVDDTLS